MKHFLTLLSMFVFFTAHAQLKMPYDNILVYNINGSAQPTSYHQKGIIEISHHFLMVDRNLYKITDYQEGDNKAQFRIVLKNHGKAQEYEAGLIYEPKTGAYYLFLNLPDHTCVNYFGNSHNTANWKRKG